MATSLTPAKAKDTRTLSRFARANVTAKKNQVRVISEQSVQDALHSVDNREHGLDEYLTKTLLKKRLVDAMHELVHMDFLPRNPYQFLVPFIRKQEIQTMLEGRRVIGLLNKVSPGLPATNYVTNIRDNFDHFGTSIILKQIDSGCVSDLYAALLACPGCIVDQVGGEYGGTGKEPHIKAITALLEPSIFYGNLLPYIETISLNHDYFVCAKTFDQCAKAFAAELSRNVFDFKGGGSSISDGVCIVQSSKTRGVVGETKTFTYHEIQTSRQVFMAQVKDAVREKRSIYVEGIVWLPLGAAHGFDKVAMKRASNEAALLAGDGETKKDPKKKKIMGTGLLARAAAKQQEKVEAERRAREKQMSIGGFYAIRKNYVFHYKLPEPAQPDPSSADGYKHTSVKYDYESLAIGLYEKKQDAVYYASAWKGPKPGEQAFNSYTKPLKSQIIKNIAERHQDGDWVASYEKLLTLIVWNEGTEAALVSQIFNSMVGTMRQLSIEAKTMHDVLARCLKSSDELSRFSSNLLKEFSVFYNRVAKLIGGTAVIDVSGGASGSSSSSILASLKLMIRARLASTVDEKTKRMKLEPATLKGLNALSRTFRVIELSLAADAVPLFKEIETLVDNTVKNAEELHDKDIETKKATGSKDAAASDAKKKRDQTKEESQKKEEEALVIDVMQETRRYKQTNKFPSKVLREATVMQYLVDSRVDTTIEQMYQQLLSEPLYPNPYPRVTIVMQSAWARHEFWRRSDADMLSEITAVVPTLAAHEKIGEKMGPDTERGMPYTYIARGGNDSAVYGTLSSIRVADPKNLCQLWSVLPELKNQTDISQHVRNNKEEICTSLVGRTALEFRIAAHDEALPSFIECHEHYIITGTQQRTAIRLFVEHVIKYAQWLHMDTPHLVTVLSTGQIDPNTGNSGTRGNFYMSDLKKGNAATRRELIRAANSNDSIFLHGLMRLDKPYSKRFVLVRKWFFFHWRDPSTNNSLEKQSHIPPSSLMQAVYFSVKEAATVIAVIQEKLPEEQQDPEAPQNIGEYVSLLKRNVGRMMISGDVLNAYHEMVPLTVAENRMDQLCDLTRMLNSTAELVRDAIFENRVLQELVRGLSQADVDDSFKGKISLSFVKEQVNSHRERCKAILTKSGDVFVSGAQVEIFSTVDKLARVIGSSNHNRVEEALSCMKATQQVLIALSAIVAYAIHNNCGHINEDMKSFVELIQLESSSSSSSPRRSK